MLLGAVGLQAGPDRGDPVALDQDVATAQAVIVAVKAQQIRLTNEI